MKGIFIVIDGTDGAGKKTQYDRLIERLRSEDYDVATADFPQYGEKSAGLVENYLNGKYGGPNDVTAKQASVFYAVDRFDASFWMRKELEQGKVLISNRYVSASMGHQGGKIREPQARQELIQWIKDLEYGIFQIPIPDLTMILYVDPVIAQQNVDKKAARDYVHGKKRDIHEDDLDHLKNAAESFREVAALHEKTLLVDCMDGDRLMSIDEIHAKIWAEVEKVLKKP